VNRYLALLDYTDGEDSSINGTLVTVEAHSDMQAFDTLLMEHGGEANITILGTCDEIAKLATERSLESRADYQVEN
jgi:hypothetical protein